MTSPPQKAASPARHRLPGRVVALGLVSLLTDVSSEMTYTQIPIFLKEVLGAHAWVLGLIEGLAESTASLLRLVSGWLSDRSGRRKPLLLLGYGFGALSKPLLALAHSSAAVLMLRVLDRTGKGLRTAPRDALIAESTPFALRGRSFGLHRAMDTTGAVLGPLLGFWFLSRLTGSLDHRLRMLFLFAGGPGLLAVLALLLLVREPRRHPEKPATGSDDGPPPDSPTPLPAGLALPVWRDLNPAYRRFLLITLLFNLGNSSDIFLILRAKSLGFAATEILLLYAAFNGVEALLGYAAGALSDRVGRRPLIIAGYGLFALVYLGFALAHTKAAIWALFLIYGGYYTLTQGVQRAFAADFADPIQRATQIGAYHTIVGLALLPASVIAGRLFDWNPAAPFLVGAVTATLSALLLAR